MISILHLNAEQCRNSRCSLVQHLKAINSQNKPFESPKLPDWSRIVFVGYSWFRDPRFKGSENPPYFDAMKHHRLEIDTPTLGAWYRNNHVPPAAYLPPPEHEEINGGAVIASESPQSRDTGEALEEQQSRHKVIAHLAWVVDSGATFDTVPLGYAKQEDL